MADYYELLGVPEDASREDIRAAYRDLAARTTGDDKARLNQAWNVLSDPYQRGRYDQQLSDGSAADVGSGDVEIVEEEPLDPRAARAKARAEARQAALIPDPLPAGLQYPAPAQRFTAFGIDFFVLLVIFFLTYIFVLLGGPLKKDLTAQQKAQKAQYEQTIKTKDAEAKKYDNEKDAANDAADAAKAKGDTAEQQKQEAAAKAADKKASAAKKASDEATKKKLDLEAPSGTQIAVYAILTPLLMLAYLVIPSIKRGQSPGKKLRGIRVVSINGADASVPQLLIRYGAPIVVAVDLFIVLSQIAPLLALFGVLMWPRNKLRQGVHDKMAKTLVVDNTVEADFS